MLKRLALALCLSCAPALASAQNPQVGDFAASPISTMARPANTTTYGANTGWCLLASACVSTFIFNGACQFNFEQIEIRQVDIYSSKNPTTKLQGILWLFTAPPATIVSDDATFNIAAADFANLTGGVGGIAFTLASPQASGAANSGVSTASITRAQCNGSTTLYGVVQVVNAYVPASGEVLSVQLRIAGVN